MPPPMDGLCVTKSILFVCASLYVRKNNGIRIKNGNNFFVDIILTGICICPVKRKRIYAVECVRVRERACDIRFKNVHVFLQMHTFCSYHIVRFTQPMPRCRSLFSSSSSSSLSSLLIYFKYHVQKFLFNATT